MDSDIPSTQGQFWFFIELFREFTQTVTSALYYAGVFIALLVVPICAVVLMRRRVRRRMEAVLDDIAAWDPWLRATIRDGTTLSYNRLLPWLTALCKWRTRYRGVRVIFGMPDLEAKVIQLTKALVAVLLTRTHELRELSADDRQRLTALLRRLLTRKDDPAIRKLLELLTAANDPWAGLRQLQTLADGILSWPDFISAMGAPSLSTPAEAAAHGELDRTRLPLALFLFARKACSFHDDVSKFLQAVHQRWGIDLRTHTVRVDKFLQAEGQLINAVRLLLARDLTIERYGNHPAWRRFVVAFGQSPLAALGANPDDDFAALRTHYRHRMLAVHPDLVKALDTTEEAKAVTLAWQVVLALRKDGLLT